MSMSANGWRGHRGWRRGCQARGTIGTRAADERPEEPDARSPSPRSIWRFGAPRSARVRETVKVELGVGREAETGGVHAAAYASTPRLDASASRSIRCCGPAQDGRAAEPPPRLAASHLPWAGLTLTPKLPGSHGFRLGGCRLVNHATGRSRLSLFAAVVSLRRAGRSKGRSSMGNRNFGWPLVEIGRASCRERVLMLDVAGGLNK